MIMMIKQMNWTVTATKTYDAAGMIVDYDDLMFHWFEYQLE